MSRSQTVLKYIILTAFIGSFSAASAQPGLVHLQCKGTLSASQDGQPEVKQAIVDVTLDLAKETMEVQGWWGLSSKHWHTDVVSVPIFKVKTNESEVEYFGHTEGDNYEGSTNMSLNRYSGTLRAFSVATSKPAANAKWNLMQITTEMKCVAPAKLF